MKSTLFLKYTYTFLCAITFLSFGTHAVLSNLKTKTAIAINDVADDNKESANETSKELTESFLSESRVVLCLIVVSFTTEKIPLLSLKWYSFGTAPSTPPPDLA